MSCEAVSKSLISVPTTVLQRCAAALEQGSRVRAHVGGHRCECSQDVGPELFEVVISFVEGQPGGGALGGEPVSHEGALAEAGGCGHQGQRMVTTPGGEVA